MYSPIASSIQALSDLIKDFQKRSKRLKDLSVLLGTKEDLSSLREKISLEREAALSSSKQLCQLFKQKPVDRVEKVQQAKLAKDFEAVLTEFERINAGTLEKEREIASVIEETLNDEEFRRSGTISSHDSVRRQQTLLFQELGYLEDLVLKERQEEVKQLERDILETNALFRDVAELVKEQETSLVAIEENVGSAGKSTGTAVKELEKGEFYIAEVYSKRHMSLWIWICLGLFIGIAILIAAMFIIRQLNPSS